MPPKAPLKVYGITFASLICVYLLKAIDSPLRVALALVQSHHTVVHVAVLFFPQIH